MVSEPGERRHSPFSAILGDLKRRPERLIVVQGERRVTAADLLQACDTARARLSSWPAGRVALVVRRTDTLAALLLVCGEARRDLVLLRGPNVASDDQLERWHVGLVLDENLEVASTRERDFLPERCAVLIPTSGTTGSPKLAIHGLDGLLSRVMKPVGSQAADVRWLLTYHPAGFAGLQVLLTALLGGNSLVSGETGVLAELTDAAVRHRPTHVSGTPTFWRTFLLRLGSAATSLALEQITIGGEAVEQALLSDLRRTFPRARIIHIYASSEAGALFAVTDEQSGFPASWLRDGVEGTRLRIRNGVLEVISPRAMIGYADGEKSIRADDGWLITGDLVELKGDRVYFRGRADATINVGGAKVVPEEVERVLMELPFIEDVRVFGKPNVIVGTLVHADVILEAGYSQLDARTAISRHATERLEHFKVPRVISFVSHIPVNASGKKLR